MCNPQAVKRRTVSEITAVYVIVSSWPEQQASSVVELGRFYKSSVSLVVQYDRRLKNRGGI